MPRPVTPAVPLRSKIEATMKGMDQLTPLPVAAQRLTLVCLDEVMAHLQGTLDGTDPEHLHQMRVASRRLRAALRVFEPCYPRSIGKAVEKARCITRLLGAVRDLDVRIAHLENLRKLVDHEGDRATDVLIFHSNLQREEARQNLVDGLCKMKKGNWYRWMSKALANARFPEGLDWYPSSRAISVILMNRSMVCSNAFLARVESAVTGQHQFRISIKKYKYSLELLQFCFKSGVQDVLDQCKKVQDDLGLLHDYDVLEEYMRQTRSRTMPKPIKHGMNELTETLQHLRHEQFMTFQEHLGPFLEADPRDHEK